MELVIRNIIPTTKGDKALIFLAMLVFLGSGYHLSHFASEGGVAGDAVEVGAFTTSGTIKRRHARTLHWGNVAHSGKVYLGDIVYTPKNTTTEITWGKNEKIELEPDSMVQFDEITLNRVSISLMEGKFKLGKASNKANVSVFVKKAAAEVFHVMPYPKIVKQKSILSQLEDLESQKQALDERLKTELSQKIELQELVKLAGLVEDPKKLSDYSIALTTPAPGRYDINKNSWMTMAWTKVPLKGVVYQLEISRDKTFGRVVSHKTKGDELSIQLEDLGVYYWRTKVFSGKESLTSEISEFTIFDPKKRSLSSGPQKK